MIKNIRKTLLRKLLINPKPIASSEFSKAKSRIFPNADLFEKFLKSNDSQEVTQLSKTILLRFVYQYHFPPPSRLIFNLLEIEENKVETIKDGDYIPQDHFVHLVHLYLLGIYIFSYHEKLHQKISDELNSIKRSFLKDHIDLKPIEPLELNTYKLFANMWTYFVLYHDLCYPLEMIKPEKREENIKWLIPFKKIIKSTLKDISLKSLSKFLVIRSKLMDQNNSTLNSEFLKHYSKYYFEEDINNPIAFDKDKEFDQQPELIIEQYNKYKTYFEKWENAKQVPIFGLNDLRTILSFLPDENLCAVLENRNSGEPMLIYNCNSQENLIVWFGDIRYIPNLVKRNKHKLFKLAFRHAEYPNTNYVWKYFTLDSLEYFNSLLVDILGNDGYQNLLNISNEFEKNEDFASSQISNENQYDDLGFYFYQELSLSLGYVKDLDETVDSLADFMESGKTKFKATATKIPSIISNSFKTVIKSDIENGNFDPLEIIKTNTPEDQSKLMVNHFFKLKSELVKQLEDDLGGGLKNQISLEHSIKKLVQLIRIKIIDNLQFAEYDTKDIFNQIEFNEQLSLPDILDKNIEYKNQLEQRIQELGLKDLNTIIQNYQPEWIRNEASYTNNFFDHGISIGISMFNSLLVYDNAINKLIQNINHGINNEETFLWVAFEILSDKDANWIRFERDFLFNSVLVSVLIHNIYPKFMLDSELKEYRTKIQDQPFAYLALLADGLQKWDRKRLISLASSELNSFIPGSRYNIEIKKDKLFISLEGTKLDMKQEEKNLKKNFDDFLKSGSLLVKLNLSEID